MRQIAGRIFLSFVAFGASTLAQLAGAEKEKLAQATRQSLELVIKSGKGEILAQDVTPSTNAARRMDGTEAIGGVISLFYRKQKDALWWAWWESKDREARLALAMSLLFCEPPDNAESTYWQLREHCSRFSTKEAADRSEEIQLLGSLYKELADVFVAKAVDLDPALKERLIYYRDKMVLDVNWSPGLQR